MSEKCSIFRTFLILKVSLMKWLDKVFKNMVGNIPESDNKLGCTTIILILGFILSITIPTIIFQINP